ncbi:TIGR03766 family XrtG-associated glycosyltransferase [Secundilactobacillus paracollinoides]|uniref:TIGR03766 family XrtG-associated glycosyltransferase n=1 Tax=Secundilactobacillus paracollinoides TaxID=240427 RepID=UPI0009F5DFA4
MAKLFRFGNRCLQSIFLIFIFATLLFAVTSPNLILGDNKITGAGTTLFTTGVLIVFGGIVICYQTYPNFQRLLWTVLVRHARVTAALFFVAVVIWQVVFVLSVHPVIGFDVGAVHQALTDTKTPDIVAYFSLNYNNMPLLLAQHAIAQAVGSTSWLLFDLVTLILVDISALLNIVTIYVIDKKQTTTALYIHAMWLLLFPMIIVPYTDAWVLPFVSGYFLGFAMLNKASFDWTYRSLGAILFGLNAVLAYMMKPSAIVGVIAIVIVELLYMFHPRKHVLTPNEVWRGFALLILFLGVTGGSYWTFNKLNNEQSYIVLQKNREIPAIHFMGMGVSGDGGYNPKDALKMAELPTVKARSDYSKKVLIKRLKAKGVLGYAKFLVKKQRNDTADGTFAWIKEGHFINADPVPNEKGFAGTLRSFVYLYGSRLGDFRFFAQVTWVLLLTMVAFGWRDKRKFSQICRLAIIGGMVYLLLFEGGRSRYLIQFLPSFLMLGTLTGQQAFSMIHGWYRRAFPKWETVLKKKTSTD